MPDSAGGTDWVERMPVVGTGEVAVARDVAAVVVAVAREVVPQREIVEVGNKGGTEGMDGRRAESDIDRLDGSLVISGNFTRTSNSNVGQCGCPSVSI